MECKIKNAHKRLVECHILWHQILNNYFDPEGFRTNLNAMIQALRNITFALQKEQKHFNEFDSWYKTWQEKMKQDPILKWLNESRIIIVHEQDLEKKSFARVTIYNYLEIYKGDIEIPINIPELMIASFLSENGYITKEMIELDFILNVERKWVINSLPQYEILDALAYCYGFMCNLLKEYHEFVNTDIYECSIKDKLHNSFNNRYNGVPDCMKNTNEIRIKDFSLKSFIEKKYVEAPLKLDEEIKRRVMKRYDIVKHHKQLNLINAKPYIKDIIDISKIIMSKDGYHSTIVFLIDEKNNMHQISLSPEDKSDKFLLMKEIAKTVSKIKAKEIVFVSETWLYSFDSELKNYKGKKEGLIVKVANKEGLNVSYITRFSRGLFGKITFEETVEENELNDGMFSPIFKIWNN